MDEFSLEIHSLIGSKFAILFSNKDQTDRISSLADKKDPQNSIILFYNETYALFRSNNVPTNPSLNFCNFFLKQSRAKKKFLFFLVKMKYQRKKESV